MHCHCGTNNRTPRWTFTDPCKPEVRPGAREESASPAWQAAPAMNTRDTTKVYIWRRKTITSRGQSSKMQFVRRHLVSAHLLGVDNIFTHTSVLMKRCDVV